MIYVISRVFALQALYTFEHGRSVNRVLPEGPLQSHSSLDRPLTVAYPGGFSSCPEPPPPAMIFF